MARALKEIFRALFQYSTIPVFHSAGIELRRGMAGTPHIHELKVIEP
jgi:hypothetical protein